MTRPDISVVITAYNRAALLPRALRSLIEGGGGSHVAWEAIIVDDGSTDSTPETVLQLRRTWRDQPLRYLWQPNGGLVAARNAGIRAARADYITFLDSDDEYAPDHLLLRWKLTQQHPPPDLIHGGVLVVGGPDTVPDKFDPNRSIPISECYVGGTFVFRKDLWEKLQGFRLPNYGDDHDFLTRAQAADARILRCDDPTYIYHRETPDSLCNVMGELNSPPQD